MYWHCWHIFQKWGIFQFYLTCTWHTAHISICITQSSSITSHNFDRKNCILSIMYADLLNVTRLLRKGLLILQGLQIKLLLALLLRRYLGKDFQLHPQSNLIIICWNSYFIFVLNINGSYYWSKFSYWSYYLCRIVSSRFRVNCTVFSPTVGSTLGVMKGLVVICGKTVLCFVGVLCTFSLADDSIALLCKLFINSHQTRLRYHVEGCYSLGYGCGRTGCIQWYIFIQHWVCASWIGTIFSVVIFLSTL